jgi:flagellar biosynthesis protein FlhG
MAVERVIGVAVLSGKGGVGKSVIALNLAIALASRENPVLLFDAGGGAQLNLTNQGTLQSRRASGEKFHLAEGVDLYVSSIADYYTILDENDVERFLSEVGRAVADYRFVVFDCLSGAGPIAYTLAGLSELSLIVSTPDPNSIAGAYMLVKSLYLDDLTERCVLVFNEVESADEAASLKTRFDILTKQFLDHQFGAAGHVRRDHNLGDSVLEQRPLMLESKDRNSTMDLANLADEVYRQSKFHFETRLAKRRTDR